MFMSYYSRSLLKFYKNLKSEVALKLFAGQIRLIVSTVYSKL